MTYTPDSWVVINIGEHWKVLATWYGSYLLGDDWRLSSGVDGIIEEDTYWVISNVSGSTYICYKSAEGLSSLGADILTNLQKIANVEVKNANEVYGYFNISSRLSAGAVGA